MAGRAQRPGACRLQADVIVVAEAAWPSNGRPSSCSAVPSSEQWLNSVLDLVPAAVLGLITSVATWQLTSVVLASRASPVLELPPAPSSQVMNTARLRSEPCVRETSRILPDIGQENWRDRGERGNTEGMAPGDSAGAGNAPVPNVPPDLARYLATSTGLPQPTTARVVADVNAYYDETVEDFVRRRHAELHRKNRKNDEIWPEIAGELTCRRFKAPDLTDRQLRRIVYG